MDNMFEMYSGISKESYKNIWKDKKINNRLTNVTSNFDTALDFSYDFKNGIYNDTVIKISNIPIDAFIGYRGERYQNDDDYKDMSKMRIPRKLSVLNKYNMFIVNLYPFKEQIKIELVKY